MKLFNRDLALYSQNAYRIPAYFVYFLKCFRIFKDPVGFIYSYLRMIPPDRNVVELRNGMEIHLSGHPHDIVTIFIIFVREDYGSILPDSTVIDIGANIGVFSLYAAYSGARRVKAYEPNSEAFRCLQRNIQSNGLEAVIDPHQFAVTGITGKAVRFPKEASPYNAVLREDSTVEHEIVDSIDLATIMAGGERVNVLKVDCEGAERDILCGANRVVLDHIDAIRMEYHLGYQEEITIFLQNNGYYRQYLAGTKDAGTMWFGRKR